MATNHNEGAIPGKLAGASTIHTFPVTFADVTAVAKLLCTIAATVQEPVAYQVRTILITQSNAGTSHVLAVGTTASPATELINTADLKGTVGTNVVTASNPVKIATADTPIYALPTIVGSPTAGLIYIQVETWPVVLN